MGLICATCHQRRNILFCRRCCRRHHVRGVTVTSIVDCYVPPPFLHSSQDLVAPNSCKSLVNGRQVNTQETSLGPGEARHGKVSYRTGFLLFAPWRYLSLLGHRDLTLHTSKIVSPNFFNILAPKPPRWFLRTFFYDCFSETFKMIVPTAQSLGPGFWEGVMQSMPSSDKRCCCCCSSDTRSAAVVSWVTTALPLSFL